MNKQQAIVAVKKSDWVEVGVSATKDDVFYVKISKVEALRLVDNVFSDDSVRVELQAVVINNVMYIN